MMRPAKAIAVAALTAALLGVVALSAEATAGQPGARPAVTSSMPAPAPSPGQGTLGANNDPWD